MSTEWLVLHAGALGDLALTLHVSLRLPGVSETTGLHVVSRTNPGDLSGCRPAILWRSAESLGLHWLYAEGSEPSPKELRVLVAGRSVLSMLGGVGEHVHRRLKTLGPERLFSVDPRPRIGLSRHITAQWLGDLEAQGLRSVRPVNGHKDESALIVPESLRAAGRKRLRSLGIGARSVLIHPGSGGRAKCWPLACFREVARRLSRAGTQVCFVVGPVEEETWPSREIATIGAEAPLIASPRPNELLSLLAAAGVLVSGDCGPAHLAALLGTATVTLFGPTRAVVWRPLGCGAVAIQGDPAVGSADWGIGAGGVVAAAREHVSRF